MTIWFTSDVHWHFDHQKQFLYGPRGFNSIEEHNTAILNNINEVVRPEDTLYILGDLMVCGADYTHGISMINQINCNDIKVIAGNHDTDNRIAAYYALCPHITSVEFGGRLKYHKWHFLLSHYPTKTANYDDGKYVSQRVYNLCGHVHTQDKFLDMNIGAYHVELDAHDNKPVSIDEIIEDIKDWYDDQQAFAAWLEDDTVKDWRELKKR